MEKEKKMNIVDKHIEDFNKMTNGNLILKKYYTEITIILAGKFGKNFFEKDPQSILSFFLKMGKYQTKNIKDEKTLEKYFKVHISYLKGLFYELFKSLIFMDENYPDFYNKINNEIGYDIYYQHFLLWGHNCIVESPLEIRHQIMQEKNYITYWNELFHFILRYNPKYKIESVYINSDRNSDIVINELELMDEVMKLQNISGLRKKLGRPSKISLEILEDFANRLEEARKTKRFKMTDIDNAISKRWGIDSTTLRNWLRDKKPLLKIKKKSIDLTMNDIKELWDKSQKV